MPRDEMAEVLNNLKMLNLGAQVVLGDRTNVEQATRKAKEDAQLNSKDTQKGMERKSENVIVISSGSERENPSPIRYQLPKAMRLNKLADQASNATENTALSRLVKEFVVVLKMNSSRTLTKEAFGFLDVLFKQLDDPSVFVRPKRSTSNLQVNPFLIN